MPAEESQITGLCFAYPECLYNLEEIPPLAQKDIERRDFLRIIIIANGWINQPPAILPGEILIAANGGANHCLKYSLHPDYVIGDLDSLSEQDLASLRTTGSHIKSYPARKDFTDLELAIQFSEQLGANELTIYAALGARWDQSIGNLLLPLAYPEIRIQLVDGSQEIHFIHENSLLSLEGLPGDMISLIPLNGDVTGITTRGLEYPLEDAILRFGNTRGISNVMLDQHASIAIKQGVLLCVVIHSASK